MQSTVTQTMSAADEAQSFAELVFGLAMTEPLYLGADLSSEATLLIEDLDKPSRSADPGVCWAAPTVA